MPAPGFDRRFALVVTVAFLYFVGLGVIAPVLPQYVEETLDGSGTDVGLAVGIFAVSAALLRPWVGRVGDRHGRRVLVLGGAGAAGVSIAGYGLPGGLAVLLLLRLVSGAGEAAAFVGAATTAQDLAPPERRGQAASFFSISVYGGLGVGPVLGDWAYNEHGAGWAWAIAAAACLAAALLSLAMPADVPHDETDADTDPVPDGRRASGLRALLHPAGLRPGVILLLGAAGYAGFATFVPLYIDEIGVDSAGTAFAEYAAIVLVVRVFASRLPDVLGTRRGPLLALALQSSGLLLMGAWGTATGLYTATAVYALGVSMLYPALFPAVVDAAPAAERSQAIATFTLFFDVAQGLGAPALGVIVDLGGERSAFVACGLLSALGFVLHRATPPAPPPAPPAERAPGPAAIS